MLTPLTATEMRVDGEPVPYSQRREFGRWRYAVTVEIPPGETTTVELVAAGAGPTGDTYQLTVAPQPLVTPDQLTATINATGSPSGLIPGPGLTVTGTTATYEGSPVEDTVIFATAG